MMSADPSREPLLPPQPRADTRSVGSSSGTREHHEDSWTRFLKAAGVGLLVWLLLCALVASITDWPFSLFPSLRHGNSVADASYPLDEDGEVIACYPHQSGLDFHETHSRWKDTSQSSTQSRTAYSSMSFPIDTKEDITFIARGGAVEGRLVVVETSGPTASARVEVSWNPHMTTNSPYLFEACELFDTSGGGRRVGIYMPWWTRRAPKDSIPALVVLTVSVPPGRVKSLKSQTFYYTHNLEVSNRTTFGTVDINSKLGPIYGTLSAESLTLRSSNAFIFGKYTAARELSLYTSNAQIDADLVLGSRSVAMPTFNIGTTNEPITGSLRLAGGYSFDGVVQTNDAEIDLAVTSLPINAKLMLDARTSGKPARLMLPVTYEGAITQVAQDYGIPDLTFKVAEDPLGLGRRYQVANTAIGKDNRTDHVSWGSTRGNGKISLRTSNATAGVHITTNWK